MSFNILVAALTKSIAQSVGSENEPVMICYKRDIWIEKGLTVQKQSYIHTKA